MMKRVIVFLLICISLTSMSGCTKSYKIQYDENVMNCPDRGKPGETIRFETVFITDGDLYVYINGVEVKSLKEGIYEFVMPDEDVMITTKFISNGLA